MVFLSLALFPFALSCDSSLCIHDGITVSIISTFAIIKCCIAVGCDVADWLSPDKYLSSSISDSTSMHGIAVCDEGVYAFHRYTTLWLCVDRVITKTQAPWSNVNASLKQTSRSTYRNSLKHRWQHQLRELTAIINNKRRAYTLKRLHRR